MKYVSTLIAVKDMKASIRFYREVLGLEVVADLGANVTMTGGFALQSMEVWKDFIAHKDVQLRNNDAELVFEEKDIDAFMRHLEKFSIEYVHDVVEYGWGQRVIRFYDPDYHIIEVGEDMEMVVKRFKETGMSDVQVAERMGVPLDYVLSYLKSC